MKRAYILLSASLALSSTLARDERVGQMVGSATPSPDPGDPAPLWNDADWVALEPEDLSMYAEKVRNTLREGRVALVSGLYHRLSLIDSVLSSSLNIYQADNEGGG